MKIFLRHTVKYIFIGFNILSIISLFSLFLVWKISPAKVSFLAYLGLATPFIIVANILFLICWSIFSKWKLVFVNICVLLLCYKPILTYSPLKFRDKAAPEKSIKILSYNVRGMVWNVDKAWSKNPIFSYLKSIDADIICMQEFLASTSPNCATTKKLQQALGYPYYSMTPLRSTKGGYEYGLVCFSKYPILEVEQIPIKTSDNGSVLYKLNVNGKIISLINNHLESNRLTSKDKELYKDFFTERDSATINKVTHNIEKRLGKAYKLRGPQADLIQSYISKQTSDGVIVCGDFNDTPISYTYDKLTTNLTDSYLETGFGPGITYYENHFLFRIDFILHSKNMKAYDFTIDKIKLSDHYPVWTYLSFQ